MGRELAEGYAEAASVFDRVSAAVGRDVRKLCWDADEEALRRTENAQVALYTVGLAAWEVLKAGLPEGAVEAAAGTAWGSTRLWRRRGSCR